MDWRIANRSEAFAEMMQGDPREAKNGRQLEAEHAAQFEDYWESSGVTWHRIGGIVPAKPLIRPNPGNFRIQAERGAGP